MPAATDKPRVESPLRLIINRSFEGKEPYDVVKRLVVAYLAAALGQRVRSILAGEGLRAYLLGLVMPYIKRLPFVRAKLLKETEKLRKSLRPTMLKDLTEPCRELPAEGRPRAELLRLMERRHGLDCKYWHDGKVTGSIYHGDTDYMEWIGSIYGKFAYTNPLHAMIHPATRQMDAEVIQMVVNLYNGDAGCCGAFTTGGTESILMCCKSYRDWGRATKGVTQPNIVVCVTAHAAFDKAGQYFGIQVRKARATAGAQEVDLAHVRRLIDANTVALVGSAPQFAHGTVDDIDGLSHLALEHGCGLHVDCCLGGFLLPFMGRAGYPLARRCDFRVPGVTTISCDPHKYGFAPKGCSVAMFRSAELRHHMYCFVTDWTGGIYATPTMLGSRPGGVVAATWAAMMTHGVDGYVETTRRIVGAVRAIEAGIRTIDGLEVVGRADVCVVAFGAAPGSGLNPYSVGDAMKALHGWDLATLQSPAAVHLAATLPSAANAAAFVDDLRAAVAAVRADTTGKYSDGTAGVYGMAASLPSAFIQDSVKVFLDTMASADDPGGDAIEEVAV